MGRHAVRHSLPVSFTETSLIVHTFVCPEPSHDSNRAVFLATAAVTLSLQIVQAAQHELGGAPER
jgi:hypothetical protein